MRDDGDLDPYEIAYLCGGPERVAMVALVALQEDGLIRITPASRRVTVVRRERRDAVETAAFKALTGSGKLLGSTLQEIAASPAVQEIGGRLRAEGLLPASRLGALWQRKRAATARETRRRLVENSDHKVAALGAEGIADRSVRRLFETPDPPGRSSRGRGHGSGGSGSDTRYGDGGGSGGDF